MYSLKTPLVLKLELLKLVFLNWAMASGILSVSVLIIVGVSCINLRIGINQAK